MGGIYVYSWISRPVHDDGDDWKRHQKLQLRQWVLNSLWLLTDLSSPPLALGYREHIRLEKSWRMYNAAKISTYTSMTTNLYKCSKFTLLPCLLYMWMHYLMARHEALLVSARLCVVHRLCEPSAHWLVIKWICCWHCYLCVGRGRGVWSIHGSTFPTFRHTDVTGSTHRSTHTRTYPPTRFLCLQSVLSVFFRNCFLVP